MKLLCKLFGHKWEPMPFTMSEDRCVRCGEILKHNAGCFIYDFNRSDIDESENVFPEKWLDKHMD
ncbi:DUF1660 domain-containing protein [Lactococcus lactis subsp. lactis]|uniref:DUF1660 domain-containing protein n=1 Tax=Lactococcus lactis TaxID=1358 RepID=UPI0029405953|nr:DUF1660 domain-containing protein [Lactococcus lactis]MDV4193174.1 DUF1660 domain-containing protein [Lactococcus lactis subsp. lactis]